MDITQLLEKARNGDRQAEHDLIPLVYDELKRLAAGHLKSSSSSNITLNPTALVHEAFLRLPQCNFESRNHFFGIASRLMRNVIVDAVRHAHAQKRGGGPQLTVRLDDIEDLDSPPDTLILDLNAALDKLALVSPDSAKVVEMRYFAGLTLEQTSEALSISVSTAQRELRFARAWLRRELSSNIS